MRRRAPPGDGVLPLPGLAVEPDPESAPEPEAPALHVVVPEWVIALVENEVAVTVHLDSRVAYERVRRLALKHTRHPPEMVSRDNGERRIIWPSMGTTSRWFSGH